ncbi:MULTISPECIES: hypothetical protein [Sphingobium]|uniref:hypothetical protein n=1 Tax=Sphingobium sp. MI1205 TaxID=407020 RepID=UPI001F1EC83B|nr:hypothetical protein [Sphingobium sp. MI1205]
MIEEQRRRALVRDARPGKLLIDIGDDDGRAIGLEEIDDRQSDTARAAGDDGPTAMQAKGPGLLLSDSLSPPDSSNCGQGKPADPGDQARIRRHPTCQKRTPSPTP